MSEEHLDGPGRGTHQSHVARCQLGPRHADCQPGRDTCLHTIAFWMSGKTQRAAKIIPDPVVEVSHTFVFVVWIQLRDSTALWGSSGTNETLCHPLRLFQENVTEAVCQATSPCSLRWGGEKGGPQQKTPFHTESTRFFPWAPPFSIATSTDRRKARLTSCREPWHKGLSDKAFLFSGHWFAHHNYSPNGNSSLDRWTWMLSIHPVCS